MQLPGLIGFICALILACNSDDKGWKINVNRNITVESGSDVIIQCNFSYPEKYQTKTKDVTVYWKKLLVNDQSNCSDGDKDKTAFVYHSNKACVLGKYKGNTSLIGDKDKGDCSLRIGRIESPDQGLYVRILVKDKYSFWNDNVTIIVKGAKPDTNPTAVAAYYTTPAFSSNKTTITNEKNLVSTAAATALYVSMPVAAVIILLAILGICIFQKYKRSRNVSREDSGYYANFSRALSNPPKREVSCNTQDEKLPERKVIDDPVYVNVKAPPGHTDENMDCVDNIYANMDYRKATHQ